MDVRVQGFVQRTIKKIGSWNLKMLQTREKSQRSQCLLLQEAVTTLDVPAVGNILGLQEAIATLDSPPQEQTIQDALGLEEKIDLENAAVEEEMQINQSEPHKDLQYTDGEVRIIGAHDGYKDCFALLLNEEIVSKIQAITTASRRLNLIKNDFEDAELQATVTKVNMNQIMDSLEATDNEEEANQIRAAIEQEESRLCQANEKRDDLEFDLTNLKHSLEASMAYSHDLFERVLGKANLLTITEPEPEAVPSAPQTPIPISRRNSTALSQSSQSSISSEERNRRALREEVEFRTNALQKLEYEFYHRSQKYEQEREVWRWEVREGVCQVSKSVFDNACLADQFQLTRNLIEAEEARDDAVFRAWKLGVLENDSERSSHFIDDVDDGYSLSLETSMKATVDRGFIGDWINGVVESREKPILRPDSEEDESGAAKWDVRSVGLSESLSIVAESRNQKRIRRWKEMCEIERQKSERLRREILRPKTPEYPEELGPLEALRPRTPEYPEELDPLIRQQESERLPLRPKTPEYPEELDPFIRPQESERLPLRPKTPEYPEESRPLIRRRSCGDVPRNICI